MSVTNLHKYFQTCSYSLMVKQMLVNCRKHGLTKGHSNGKNNDLRCGECSRIRVREALRKQKQKAVEYKGGVCEDCGYSKCIAALDFHHLDPSQKDFSIGGTNYHKLEALKPELDKCVLLCANCHRERHFLADLV